MCIVFSIIEYVYRYLGVVFIEYVYWWEFVCELSKTLYALYSFLLYILWVRWWPSPKDSESLSFLSLHSLLMWLHFIVWSESITTFLHISIVSLSSSSLLVIHLIRFTPPCSFLALTYSRFDVSLSSFLHISLLVWFASLSCYWHHIHVRHPQVHSLLDLLYMLHFTYEGMGFWSLGIWA